MTTTRTAVASAARSRSAAAAADAVDPAALTRELAELVRIRSITGDEEDLAAELVGRLEGLGMAVEVFHPDPAVFREDPDWPGEETQRELLPVVIGRLGRPGGKRVILSTPEGFVYDMRAISQIYRDGDGRAIIDIASEERRTLVQDLANSPDGLSGWLGANRMPLVGAWVLIAPWGVDLNAGHNPPNARLLNLGTDELIELPAGTFGWD